jgi:hypothetical protein
MRALCESVPHDSLIFGRSGAGFTQPIDRRLLVHTADSIAVVVARIVAMPMAEYVVIAACSAVLR